MWGGSDTAWVEGRGAWGGAPDLHLPGNLVLNVKLTTLCCVKLPRPGKQMLMGADPSGSLQPLKTILLRTPRGR